MRLLEIKLEYKMPNFNYEWDEAQRYPKLKKLGKIKWLLLSKEGQKVLLSSLGDVSNLDPYLSGLEKEKVKRAESSFIEGKIELPIVVRIDGLNDLLGGNTRVALLQSKQIDPYVWFINIDELLNNSDK